MAGLEKISLWKGLTGTVLRRGTDFVVEMYFWKQSGSVRAVSNRDEKYVILQQWAEYYDVIAISEILKTIWFMKNKALMEYLSDIIL